jgi:sulfoxide reductase heme-binding subunit YedZ
MLILIKVLAWMGCMVPFAELLCGVFNNSLGADATAGIAKTTGLTALWMLAITLAISPVRRLSPHLAWLIRLRRMMGLFAFFYATLHMLTWVALYNNFSLGAMADDVTKRRFILAGMATYLLLLPLALTSTDWAIRKMGGKNWSRLHWLIYPAAVCAAVHYWWQMRTGQLAPLPFTFVLAVLLLSRPVLAWKKRRRERTTAA